MMGAKILNQVVMKYLSMLVGSFISIIVIMNCLPLLNKGSTVTNVIGIILVFLVVYVVIKTRLFTSFKFKRK